MEIRHTFESKNPPKSLELAVLGCHVYPETLLGTCCLGGGGYGVRMFVTMFPG